MALRPLSSQVKIATHSFLDKNQLKGVVSYQRLEKKRVKSIVAPIEVILR